MENLETTMEQTPENDIPSGVMVFETGTKNRYETVGVRHNMIGLTQWYRLKVLAHPLAANCGSALVITGIGDTMAQVLE